MKNLHRTSLKYYCPKFFVILCVSVIASCTVAPRISVNMPNNDQAIINGKIFATAFQQKAAEYRALCYQAYNIARLRVDEFAQMKTQKPKAIMTDVDETVLNNSPYQAHELLIGKDYDDVSWKDWTDRGIADTIPGALSFFRYAASKGIAIFYVTNRDENERIATLRNLKQFNFPDADNEHLMFYTTASTKEPRRDSIKENHTIIMYVGDNANDLSMRFEKKNPDERMKVADDFSADFGKSFIVLPNPIYGDWESSLYHYNYKLTPAQKDSVIRSGLRTY